MTKADPSADLAQFDLPSLIGVLDFFHQSVTLSPFVVTITNYNDGSCAYVSPTFKDLTGYSPDLFLKGGLNWLVNHLHVEDRTQFKINFTEGFLFLLKLPSYQRLGCYFNLTARLINNHGNMVWMYHQCRPIALDTEGKPQYSLNIHTDLTHLMPQDGQPCWSVVEQKSGSKPIYLGGSCHEALRWLFGSISSPLTPKETQVLKELMKGLSGKQLASRLMLSVNTINTHRKSILRKTKTKSMNEAIAKALSNEWINE